MKDTKINVEQVRSDLQQYIDQNDKINSSSVARAIGQSSATVHLFLKGTYTGDNNKVAQKIHAWLKKQAERDQLMVMPDEIIETTAVKRINQIARMCHLDGEIGVAYGDAGVGKTVAAKQYAADNPDCLLLEVDPGYTAKNLLSEIHERVGFDGRGTIYDLMQDIIEKLEGSGRMIIVDEAENLPHRALELLRRLHDKAGIGILMVGMPRLIANLRGNKGEYKQLYSRVGVSSKIDEMKDSDVEQFVATAFPSSNGLWKTFAECTRNPRVLNKLTRRAIRVAEMNNLEVDDEVVHEVKNLLIV